jgi:hypothetical protein
MWGSFKNALFYIKMSYQTKQLRKMLFSGSVDESKKKDMKILFCPFNSTILNMARESIIASSCQQRGAQIEFLQYDLLTKHNDFQTDKSMFQLGIYYKIGRLFYRINRLKVVRFSEYKPYQNVNAITDEIAKLSVEEMKSFKYLDIEVGKYAVASSIRNELSPEPLFDDPEFVDMIRSYLLTACIITDTFHRIVEQNKYDKIVTSHGIYVSWGLILDIGRKLGIDVDVYNGSYRKDTVRVYKNLPNAPFPLAEWPQFEKQTLSTEEVQIIKDYTQTREDQREDRVTLFEGDVEYNDLNEFIQKAKNENAKLATVFTNISWDAYAFSADAAFSSMIEWLQTTIELVKQREKKDIYLIVKAHPAEEFRKVPDEYRIKQSVPKDLPDNIFFINEKMSVKPFALYNHIDFGIIHISTVCIEMAMLNIPVLTSGANGHYSHKGFTIDPGSKEEYASMLDDLITGKLNFEPNIEMAQRYMYYRFFREAIPLAYITTQNDYMAIDLEASKKDTLSKAGLEVITDGIMEDAEFIFDWSKHLSK